MPGALTEEDFLCTVVKESFDSPRSCFVALAKLNGGEEAVADPQYLFRGESCYFPTTTPGTYRALVGSEPLEVKFARFDATGLFVEEYEDAGGDEEEGECLAQHYLSTSDGLDFSASPGVALAFALDRKNIREARHAYVGVLDRKRAAQSGRFSLRDLRGLGRALRPVRQHGFVAVHHAGNFVDLKEASCRQALGLEWYSFLVSPKDVLIDRHPNAPMLDALYDTRGDFWAARTLDHLDRMLEAECKQWGVEGLRHLKEARLKLLCRN